MIENITSAPSPVFITFSVDQFMILVITVVGAAVGVVIWVYEKVYNKLNEKIITAQAEIPEIKRRMDKAEEKLDEFTRDYKVDKLVSRAKKLWEKDRKEAEKKKNE